MVVLKNNGGRECATVRSSAYNDAELKMIFCLTPDQKALIEAGSAQKSSFTDDQKTVKYVLSLFQVGKPVKVDDYGHPVAHRQFFFNPEDYALQKDIIDALLLEMDRDDDTVGRLKRELHDAKIKLAEHEDRGRPRDASPDRSGEAQ